ncbi:CLUMA_CG019473, isoform A, partial [Clunio marinus]
LKVLFEAFTELLKDYKDRKKLVEAFRKLKQQLTKYQRILIINRREMKLSIFILIVYIFSSQAFPIVDLIEGIVEDLADISKSAVDNFGAFLDDASERIQENIDQGSQVIDPNNGNDNSGSGTNGLIDIIDGAINGDIVNDVVVDPNAINDQVVDVIPDQDPTNGTDETNIDPNSNNDNNSAVDNQEPTRRRGFGQRARKRIRSFFDFGRRTFNDFFSLF